MPEKEFIDFVTKSIAATSKINGFIPFGAYTWGRHTAKTDRILQANNIIPVLIDGTLKGNEPINKSLNERQRSIVALISQNRYISKEELKDKHNVSISTIKRDIKLIGYEWIGTPRSGFWQKK